MSTVFSQPIITPKGVHLQYAFWCAHKIDFHPSVSHQLSFHTKTRTISYMHIFSIFGRLYRINSEINMHIFSIFGCLYHINSHFLSTLGRNCSRRFLNVWFTMRDHCTNPGGLSISHSRPHGSLVSHSRPHSAWQEDIGWSNLQRRYGEAVHLAMLLFCFYAVWTIAQFLWLTAAQYSLWWMQRVVNVLSSLKITWSWCR